MQQATVTSTRSRDHEQRKHHRHRLSTFATLRGSDTARLTCWSRDISVGGALICSDAALPLGSVFSARFHLPWHRPVDLDVEVVRVHNVNQPALCGAQAYGVAFRQAPWAALADILNALLAEQAHARRRDDSAVLVVTRRDELQDELARDLARLGVKWVLAGTPLDLVLWMHHSRIKIRTALVDFALDHQVLFPLLGFLASEYPELRRVLVSDGAVLRRRGQAALQGHASAVLNSPWDHHELGQTLRC